MNTLLLYLVCDKDHQQWTNYSYCQKTCANRHLPESEMCTEEEQGCICKEGYFLNYNDVCVLEEQCVCNTSLGVKEVTLFQHFNYLIKFYCSNSNM